MTTPPPHQPSAPQTVKWYRKPWIPAALLLGLFSTAFLVEPAPPPPLSQEAVAFQEKIRAITPSQLKELIKGEFHPEGVTPPGDLNMLIFYASWCGYCRRHLPAAFALDQETDDHDITFRYLSVDDRPADLARYLVEKLPPEQFSVLRDEAWWLAPEPGEKKKKTSTVLRPAGIEYNGSIPYTVIFDREGRILAQEAGYLSKEKMHDGLKRLAADAF